MAAAGDKSSPLKAPIEVKALGWGQYIEGTVLWEVLHSKGRLGHVGFFVVLLFRFTLMDKVRCLRKGSNDCTYHTGQPSLHVCEHVRWLYVNSVHPSIKTYQSISLIKKKFYGSFTKLAYQFPALDYVHLINKVLSSINIILSLKKKCQLELPSFMLLTCSFFTWCYRNN